jgi:toxin ParE1/3/4
MKYRVFIAADAEEDLFEIYDYAALNDSIDKAVELIEKLKYQCEKLTKFPNRGHKLPELERIGVYEFLEIYHKPYRIIYRILENNVYVHGILDSRRDLEELLQKRLLR